MAQSSEVVEAIEIGVKTIDLECVKVHPAGLVKPDDPFRYPNQVPRGRNTSRNTRKPFCQRIEKEGLCDGKDVEEQTSFIYPSFLYIALLYISSFIRILPGIASIALNGES